MLAKSRITYDKLPDSPVGVTVNTGADYRQFKKLDSWRVDSEGNLYGE